MFWEAYTQLICDCKRYHASVNDIVHVEDFGTTRLFGMFATAEGDEKTHKGEYVYLLKGMSVEFLAPVELEVGIMVDGKFRDHLPHDWRMAQIERINGSQLWEPYWALKFEQARELILLIDLLTLNQRAVVKTLPQFYKKDH